jgi:hydroxymethylpyrimidine pyrophosphatase-like HAD family hydrolase
MVDGQMKYEALATDFDGTLAHEGKVDPETVAALELLHASGRKLILVTGRHLEDLKHIFPQILLFERVIAENGALLYQPARGETQTLGAPPPEEFLQTLSTRGIPFKVGNVIVNTHTPYDQAVLEVIRELGLDRRVIYNKGAVMVLPSDVDKASALRRALQELGLSRHKLVTAGDAENDLDFLGLGELAVAVENALPLLKEKADWVTSQPAGEGVVELIDWLLAPQQEAAPDSPNGQE